MPGRFRGTVADQPSIRISVALPQPPWMPRSSGLLRKFRPGTAPGANVARENGVRPFRGNSRILRYYTIWPSSPPSVQSSADHFDNLGHSASFHLGGLADRFGTVDDEPCLLELAEAFYRDGERIGTGADRDEAGYPLLVGYRAEALSGGLVLQRDASTGNGRTALVKDIDYDEARRDLSEKLRVRETGQQVRGLQAFERPGGPWDTSSGAGAPCRCHTS